MSQYNQFLKNAVNNALAATKPQTALSPVAQSLLAASQSAAQRQVSQPAMPSVGAQSAASATSRFGGLPDPTELGRQAAQAIQQNAIQRSIAQPTPAPPLNAGVFGQNAATSRARFDQRPAALPSSQNAMTGVLTAQPVMGLSQKAAQAAVSEGAENRPGSSTAASTGAPLSPSERLVSVYSPDGKLVIVPESRASTLPTGWQKGSEIEAGKVDRAKQSPAYIDNQDAQTQAQFPVATPVAPVTPAASGGATQQTQMSGMGGGSGMQQEAPGPHPVSAKGDPETTYVVVTSSTDPSAQPVIMTEWEYWNLYANDPEYQVLSNQRMNAEVAASGRMIDQGDYVAQRQKGVEPSANTGNPGEISYVTDAVGNAAGYAGDKIGEAASYVGGKVADGAGALWGAVPDTVKHGAAEAAKKSGQAVLESRWVKSAGAAWESLPQGAKDWIIQHNIEIIDMPRGFTVETGTGAIYKKSRGESLDGGDVATATYLDSMTVAATAIPGGGDKSISAYIEDNQDEADRVYRYGWDADGDGVADYTGDRAIWEWYVNSLSVPERMFLDTVTDPLSATGVMGKAGRGLRVAGRAVEGAEDASIVEKAIGKVLTGAGAVAEAPEAVFDKPVDFVFDHAGRVVGKVVKRTPMSVGEEKAGQAAGTLEQVTKRDSIERRSAGGEGGVPPTPAGPDGSVAVGSADAEGYVLQADGTRAKTIGNRTVARHPDGTMVITRQNADTTIIYPDGSQVTISKDQAGPLAPTAGTPTGTNPSGGPTLAETPAGPEVPKPRGEDVRTPGGEGGAPTHPASAASKTVPASTVPEDWGAPTVTTTDGVTESRYPNGTTRYVDETTGEAETYYADGVRVVETPNAEPLVEYEYPDGSFRETPPTGTAARAGRIDTLEYNQVAPARVGDRFPTEGLDKRQAEVVTAFNQRLSRQNASKYKTYIDRPDYYPARQEIDIATGIAAQADELESRFGRITPSAPPAVGKASVQGNDVRRVLYEPWDTTATERSRLYKSGAISADSAPNGRAREAYRNLVESHARFVPEDVEYSADFRRALDQARDIYTGGKPRIDPYSSRLATRRPGNVGIVRNPRAEAEAAAGRTSNLFDRYRDSYRAVQRAEREKHVGAGGWVGDGSAEPVMVRGRALAPSEYRDLTDDALAMPREFSQVDHRDKRWVKEWEKGERKGVETETPLDRWERKADEYERRGLDPRAADTRAAQDVISDMNRWNDLKYGMIKGRATGEQSTAAMKAFDVYRNMQQLSREGMLTGPTTGLRYVTNQGLGNAVTLIITRNGDPLDLLRYTFNVRGLKRNYEDITKLANFQHTLDHQADELLGRKAAKDGISVGEWVQLSDKSDVRASRVGYRIRNDVETQVRMEMGDITAYQRSAWAKLLGSPFADGSTAQRVADVASRFVSVPEFAKAAAAYDMYARKFLQERIVKREWSSLLDDITERVVKETNGRVGREEMADFVARTDGGWFSQDDLRVFLKEQGVSDATSVRVGSAWQEGVNRVYDKGAQEVKRVMFYGRTNADELMGHIFAFHYWMSRASKLYAQELLSNPAYLAAYIRMNKGLEHMAEDGRYPAWLRGTIRIGLGLFPGFNIYLNPMQFLQTLVTGQYGDTFDDKDVPTWRKVLEATGLMMSPPLQTALDMAGLGGDGPIADPIGASATVGTAVDAANFVQAQTNPSGGVIADPYQKALRWGAEKVSAVAAEVGMPGAKPVAPKTGTEQKNREINEMIITIAEEKGIISSDVAERARQADANGQTLPDEVVTAMNNPDDPLWQEAYQRVAVKDVVLRTTKATPFGVLYPQVRTETRDERLAITDRGSEDLPAWQATINDILSIARTGRPERDRPASPEVIADGGKDPQTGNVSLKERALRQYYGSAYQSGTSEADQAYAEGRITNSATSESAQLQSEVEKVYSAGTSDPRVKVAANRANRIVYGEDDGSFKGVFVKGTIYTPEQLASMTDSQRRSLAAMWLDEQGMTAAVKKSKDDRDAALVASSPQTQQFFDWRGKAYQAGPGYAEQLARENPSYGAFYNGLSAEQKQKPNVLFGTDGYLAMIGTQSKYNDPAGMATQDPGKRVADPLSSSGYYSPYTEEPSGSKKGSTGTSSKPPKTHADAVREDQAEYQRKVEQWQWQAELVLGYTPLPGATSKDEKTALKAAGVDQDGPSKSTYQKDYEFWAGQQSAGSDTSPEAYEVWRVAQGYQDAIVDPNAPPAGTPIGGSASASRTQGKRNTSFEARANMINALPVQERQRWMYAADGSLTDLGILLAAEAKRNGYKIAWDGKLVKK
ncbi:MAG: hypothetical protein QM753_11950 [Thermomicrobiales bacterium]